MSYGYTQTIKAFDGKRTFPWVSAGEIVEGTQTLTEVMDEAGLSNWNIGMERLMTESGIAVDNRHAIVRHDNSTVLGVVGNRYRIHQNEEAFAPVQDILDSSDLIPETAGYKNDGQQVFISLRLPEGIQIGGEDSHDARLLAVTSHDGSLATTFAVMMGRFACFNALRPSLSTPRKFSIRHTSNSGVRIAEAREALDITFSYVDEFNQQMQRWLDEPVTSGEFERVVHKMLPIREGLSEGRVATLRERHLLLWHLFEDSETNTFGRGTKYAAYNALNEYSNWYMPIRGGEDRRALRTLDDDGLVAQFDAKAQQVLAGI